MLPVRALLRMSSYIMTPVITVVSAHVTSVGYKAIEGVLATALIWAMRAPASRDPGNCLYDHFLHQK